jgi:hypothetical protein
LRAPIWNNNTDGGVLFNFAGDEITRSSYVLPAPTRTLAFNGLVTVAKALPSTPTGATLEDGDFVVFIPDATSSIWTGNVLRGSNGPGGIGVIALPDGTFPVPGVPMFALLAEAGGTPVLVGATGTSQLLSRGTAFKSGNPLNLFINDDNPGGFGTGGFFVCRVMVFRH